MIRSKLSQALLLLSGRTAHAIEALPPKEQRSIQEIRLRRGGFLGVTALGQEYFVCPGGVLKMSPESALRLNDDDIDHTYRTALKNSLHSFENEIRQGFVTAEGGNRVGFCGKAVCSEGSITTVRDISSVNIRVASEILGCADQIYEKIFTGGLRSLMIAGAPASGKTTVLRDLCRQLSERYRIALIDERNELAAVSSGMAQNDVGPRTDIFSGYPKQTAVMTAVRVMSPQIIVCDEAGSEDELPAYEYALNSGVRLILTCHASNMKELRRRPVIGRLIRRKAFDDAVFLGSGGLAGRMLSHAVLGEKDD
ncbi:MAG: stage III sporulation protein AA [Ruminococcus sp.]|nr:stage III sporulation protein AA [Ruminococcus sp.]